MAIETKSTGSAIVLSFFWTGLGQLYAGRIGRGLIMMVSTPIIWLIAWFGGFVGIIASIASLLGETNNPAPSQTAGAGIIGVLLVCGGAAWWIWGMVDAKRLCETFNQSYTLRETTAELR